MLYFIIKKFTLIYNLKFYFILSSFFGYHQDKNKTKTSKILNINNNILDATLMLVDVTLVMIVTVYVLQWQLMLMNVMSMGFTSGGEPLISVVSI